jgi:ABC-type branched-subunit amino acid transport system substrate-binding protein
MIRTVSLVAAAAGVTAVSGLSTQNSVIRGTLANSTAFDRIVKIGAPISMDADDKYASLGGQLWGGWQLWKDWVNLEKGGITVGTEKWGIELIQIEDKSDAAHADYATRLLVNDTVYNVDIMFGPYSSGLTKGVMAITEPDGELLLSAGSNMESLWATGPVNAWGMLAVNGGYYEGAMATLASKGASKVYAICNNNAGGKTCSTNDESFITTAVVAANMTMIDYYEVDSTTSTYMTDLMTGLNIAKTAGADVVVINDYSAVCVDGVAMLQEMGWTPNALFLAVCNGDHTVVAAIGDTAMAYITTYTGFTSVATYTSGIGVV